MIKKINLLMLVVAVFAFTAQAQELPAPSPAAKVEQRVGLTDIVIEYSRPSVKGREIFGGLLEADQVWRTGANAPTKITFSTDVRLEGVEVPKGSYSVFTRLVVPNWVLILNSDLKASEGTYKAENNVVEIPLNVMEMADNFSESMIFYFANLGMESAELRFEWDRFSWILPIDVDAREMAMKNIEEKMKEENLGFYPYHSSASYYLANNIELEQALEWSKKSVKLNAQYWNVGTLAEIYAANGDMKNAIKTAKKSLDLAEKAGDKAYIFKNKENIAKWSAK